MNKDDRLEKIEKQLELLMLKVDIIYRKLAHDERMLDKKPDHRSKDDLFKQAETIVIKAGEASAGLLQKKLLTEIWGRFTFTLTIGDKRTV